MTDRRKSGAHEDLLALILPGRWSEVLPHVIPPITENRSSEVSYRFGALSIPAHTCLLDAGTYDLFDRALSRVATNLETLLDVT